MLRNNILAILAHVILSSFVWIIFFKVLTIDMDYYFISTMLITIVVAVIYFISGFAMNNIKESVYDFLSVASLSIILLLIVLIKIVFSIGYDSNYVMFYYISNFSFYPMIFLSRDNPIAGLILACMPSLLMFAGMEFKRWRTARKSKACSLQ